MLCVCKVTATDLDSVTNSQLTYSVSDNSFSVQTLNNIGYIKTARCVSLYTSHLLASCLHGAVYRSEEPD